MYFSYGFPKAFRLWDADQSPSDVVYTCFGGDFLVVVTTTTLQIWTGGQQRLKLGEFQRDKSSVEEEGRAICACWCPSKRVIAIATDRGYLQFYGLLLTKEVIWECPGGHEARRMSIYLQNSVNFRQGQPQTESIFRESVVDFCGDGRSLLVTLRNGTLLVYSWQAHLRCSSSLLDMLSTGHASRHRLRRHSSGQHHAHNTMSEVGSSGGLSRALSTSMDGHSASSPIQLDAPVPDDTDVMLHQTRAPSESDDEMDVLRVSYTATARLLVVVLRDGCVALVSFPDSGLAGTEQARFLRWIYKPASPVFAAVSAAVQPSGNFIAVGLAHGRVAMYSMGSILSSGQSNNSEGPVEGRSDGDGGAPATRQLTPNRVLSLTEWGYSSRLVGAAHVIQWSPNGQVLGVGYALRGMAVWTPSGCRVMCSLRQAAQGMVGTDVMPDHHRNSTSEGLESVLGDWTDFDAALGSPSGLNPQHGRPSSEAGVLERGVRALSWSPNGYSLVIAEASPASTLLEIPFARSVEGHHRVSETTHLGAFSGESAGAVTTFAHASRGVDATVGMPHTCAATGTPPEEYFVLQAADRLLLISETVPGNSSPCGGPNHQPDLMLHHIRLPQQYLDSAFPVLHVALSTPGGKDIAVAGVRGLAVFTPRSRRWRLFGDAMQEKQIRVHSLAWLSGGVIAACALVEDAARGGVGSGGGTHQAVPSRSGGGQEIPSSSPAVLFYPRHHLDASSLLEKYALTQLPAAMDAVGAFLALAFEQPLQITVLRAENSGNGALHSGKFKLSAVRELSILGLGSPLLDATLLAPPVSKSRNAHDADAGEQAGGRQANSSDVEDIDEAAPSHCVLLRGGGILSVLDLQQGTEVVLSNEIESYWIPSTPGVVPVLAHMHNNNRPQTPSSPSLSTGMGLNHHVDASQQASPAAKGAAWLERRTSDAAAAAAMADIVGDMASMLVQEEAARVEMPWWTYGSRGMQLWFPSTFSDPELFPATTTVIAANGALHPAGRAATDPELEFDREVYPLGVSLSDVSIVGVTQRTSRIPTGLISGFGHPAAPAATLSFHPHPESQPVLPCLLRRLLEQGQAADALELATRHSRGPHFARSLEWLLFTTLEADADSQKDAVAVASSTAGASLSRRVRFQWPDSSSNSNDSIQGSGAEVAERHRPEQRAGPLLVAAARLVQQFPQASEIIVSVARKTDAQLWPALFAAAGPPSQLCDGLLRHGALQSAACSLLIVDRVEGPSQAHKLALRLVRAALASGRYELVADLLRFLLPPGEGELPGLMGHGWQGILDDANTTNTTHNNNSGGMLKGNIARHSNGGSGGMPLQTSGGGKVENRHTQEGKSSLQGSVGYATWLWSFFSGADMAPPTAVAAERAGDEVHGARPGSNDGLTAALHRAVSAASLADSEEERNHGELTPAIHAWRSMGTHAWKLLDAGALKVLAGMGMALGDLHGGLAAVLSTTAADVPLSLGHTTPSAAAIASALFVVSNEFASADSDADVAEAADALRCACQAAGCINHSAALALVLGVSDHLDAVSAAHPHVWAVLQDLIANDVHLCSYTSVVSPPGTPLVLTT